MILVGRLICCCDDDVRMYFLFNLFVFCLWIVGFKNSLVVVVWLFVCLF
eukprot:UN04456